MCVAPAAAQTITSADAPTPGELLEYYTIQDIGTFSSGPSQTWVVDGTPVPNETIEMIPVNEAMGASNFPLATIASNGDDGEYYSFFRTNAGGLDYLGAYYPVDEEMEFYSDPDRWIPYPCSFGTTWTDGYTVLDGPGGTQIGGLVPTQWTADGFGTLVADGGALSNVLKTHSEFEITEIVEGDVLVTSQSNDRFWKPGYPGFVAFAATYAFTINGSTVLEGSTMTLLSELVTGLRERDGYTIGMQVFPNPANGANSWLDYGSATAASLRMVNSAGQLVYEQALGDRGPGIHRAELPTAELAPGLYHVEVSNADGERGVVKVMVE